MVQHLGSTSLQARVAYAQLRKSGDARLPPASSSAWPLTAASSVLEMGCSAQALLIRLRYSPFIRNVVIVMSGIAIAQVLGFALSPVIRRLFTPGDFGVFGSFISITNINAAGVTLEYSQAIVLPRKNEDAFHLFVIACLATLTVSLVCAIACLVLPHSINRLIGTNNGWAHVFLVLATLAAGLNSSCQAWCVRAKAFKHTSSSQVIRSVSSNSLQITLGYFKAGAPGLIIGDVLANVLASASLFRVMLPDMRVLRPLVRWERIRRVAREYRDFPMYSASQNVINALSTGLPVLLLTQYYGIGVAGAYAFGMRVLGVPMAFVHRALRQVLLQRAAESQHDGQRLSPLYIRTTLGLLCVAVLPALVLGIWAPWIFSTIFGNQWYSAGELASRLVPWLLFSFCNLPAALFARIIRVQRMVFMYDLVLLALRTLALVLGGLHLEASETVLLYSLVGAIMNAVLVLLVGNALRQRERATTGRNDHHASYG